MDIIREFSTKCPRVLKKENRKNLISISLYEGMVITKYCTKHFFYSIPILIIILILQIRKLKLRNFALKKLSKVIWQRIG